MTPARPASASARRGLQYTAEFSFSDVQEEDLSALTPKQVVERLDKYIVGQVRSLAGASLACRCPAGQAADCLCARWQHQRPLSQPALAATVADRQALQLGGGTSPRPRQSVWRRHCAC